MNKVPTAEEFLEEFKATRLLLTMTSKDIQEYAIEFAKLYVEAVLKEASNNATITHTEVEVCDNHTPYWGPCGNCGYYSMPTVDVAQINKDSILNSYPLEKIK